MVKYLKRLENRREPIILETGSKRYFGKLIFKKGAEENTNNQYQFRTNEGEIFSLTHCGPNRVKMLEGRLVQLSLD